jgi:hypothetical protein
MGPPVVHYTCWCILVCFLLLHLSSQSQAEMVMGRLLVMSYLDLLLLMVSGQWSCRRQQRSTACSAPKSLYWVARWPEPHQIVPGNIMISRFLLLRHQFSARCWCPCITTSSYIPIPQIPLPVKKRKKSRNRCTTTPWWISITTRVLFQTPQRKNKKKKKKKKEFEIGSRLKWKSSNQSRRERERETAAQKLIG